MVVMAVGLIAIQPGGARAAALEVIPFPGTPDASPGSQIIFSSLARSDLVSVRVIGSRSGLHAGHLIVLPEQAGTAFVPARPFVSGDTVKVTAILSSPAIGARAGDPGSGVIRYSFAVTAPPPRPLDSHPSGEAPDASGARPSTSTPSPTCIRRRSA